MPIPEFPKRWPAQGIHAMGYLRGSPQQLRRVSRWLSAWQWPGCAASAQAVTPIRSNSCSPRTSVPDGSPENTHHRSRDSESLPQLQDRNSAAMAIKEPVNKVEVSRTTTAGTDSYLVRKMCLGPCRKGGRFLMAHV